MSQSHIEIKRRRTFAIISHPDAGKTTLTEKLLLGGGAIHLAGDVKARGERRRAKSDWMKIEQERGISVSASAMCFEYRDCIFNLLDTPGHEDFSEDTYRTLTAVDSAVMVIDAAKGIEPQTLKLFEVCRMRDIPIITFINKMDRESRDSFEILDEISQKLALDTAPMSWPVGMGETFAGVYDFINSKLILLDKTKRHSRVDGIQISDLNDPALTSVISSKLHKNLVEELEMVTGLLPAFDQMHYEEGSLTPVFFGSALWNFGIPELLDGLVDYAPSPRIQKTLQRLIEPTEDKLTGFVFKIQANMDPKHRDRIAFMRIMSGHFKRGMKLKHVRTDKTLTITTPMLFMAGARETADDAYAGDIIGIPNHGQLRVGDTLTEGEKLNATGIPMFAPELLQVIRSDDPMKARHLQNALLQFAEEGTIRFFKTTLGGTYVVGVVGALQFDVLKDRIKNEYNIPIRYEAAPYSAARWLDAEDPKDIADFLDKHKGNAAEDHLDNPIFLARSSWDLMKLERDETRIKLLTYIEI
ncbi:MAG: peptide chain release factor 3 [Alphaproteobacteria bacterium]|jgi:peptide chain release factor 3